jgi:hypothetical protein
MIQALSTPVAGAPDLATRAATDAAVATDAGYPAHHATDGRGQVGGHH